jgi:hypothetical protein
VAGHRRVCCGGSLGGTDGSAPPKVACVRGVGGCVARCVLRCIPGCAPGCASKWRWVPCGTRLHFSLGAWNLVACVTYGSSRPASAPGIEVDLCPRDELLRVRRTRVVIQFFLGSTGKRAVGIRIVVRVGVVGGRGHPHNVTQDTSIRFGISAQTG